MLLTQQVAIPQITHLQMLAELVIIEWFFGGLIFPCVYTRSDLHDFHYGAMGWEWGLPYGCWYCQWRHRSQPVLSRRDLRRWGEIWLGKCKVYWDVHKRTHIYKWLLAHMPFCHPVNYYIQPVTLNVDHKCRVGKDQQNCSCFMILPGILYYEPHHS